MHRRNRPQVTSAPASPQSTGDVRGSFFPTLTAEEFRRGLFGSPNPLEVEIGPGRGEFLFERARGYPERNFLAIERAAGRSARLRQNLRTRQLHNVCVTTGDAACVVRLFPACSVAAYHILFPDPWWKRRHYRRRLFTPEFVAAVCRTLVANGEIFLVTDVEAYFGLAQQLLSAVPDLDLVSAGPGSAPSTTFAEKATARGSTFWRSIHRRRAAGPQLSSPGLGPGVNPQRPPRREARRTPRSR